MISQETCVKIWHCNNEIKKAQQLLAELGDIVKKDIEKGSPRLSDAFGERCGLTLGVPTGDSGHKLYNVPIDLGVKVIEAHIEHQKNNLVELKALAKLELYANE